MYNTHSSQHTKNEIYDQYLFIHTHCVREHKTSCLVQLPFPNKRSTCVYVVCVFTLHQISVVLSILLYQLYIFCILYIYELNIHNQAEESVANVVIVIEIYSITIIYSSSMQFLWLKSWRNRKEEEQFSRE